MSNRIEAAAKAINSKHEFRMFLPWPDLVKSSDRANRNRVKRDMAYAEAAIEAADGVMFSEAMEAKVAELLSEARGFTWQVQASMIFQLLRGEK